MTTIIEKTGENVNVDCKDDLIVSVKKRNGKLEKYTDEKIYKAIENAMLEVKQADIEEDLDYVNIETIISNVEDKLLAKSEAIISVEEIQNLVEFELMNEGYFDVAKAYILYREKRKNLRNEKNKYEFLSNEFLSKYKHQKDPFPTELGKFVYYRTYSRPIPEEGRRERWWETVARVVEFNIGLQASLYKIQGRMNDVVSNSLKLEAEEIYDNIYNLRLFPSGRTLWVGGTTPSYKYPLSNFNCSFIAMDELTKFSEIFFLLMLGTGAGVSVESKYINKLPKVNTNIEIIHKNYNSKSPRERNEYTELLVKDNTMLEIVIGDSKFGWSKAIDMYFEVISAKQYEDVKYILINYDHVRAKGERLKVFGGYASGHIAIQTMFDKINNLLQSKNKNNMKWQKIKPIDALDISTIIAENVVSGGTRRSAEIIFCDKDDKEVIEAKQNLYYIDEHGNWQSNNQILHRMLSNNTILYSEPPTKQELSTQFEMMRKSGEPAFGNMAEMLRRRPDAQGGNPCMEILLRDRGVCNLTEVNMFSVVNPDGSYDKELLLNIQRYSARMGYRMATIELELHSWDLVNKEDMLTGCSLTGVMDFKNATKMPTEEFESLLRELRQVAHEEIEKLSNTFGLNKSKLITTVKPSGTISQLPTVSSGMHFSHSPYYIRRVRVNANDPLALAMEDAGFTWEPEVGQTRENHDTRVLEFPVKAPEGVTKYNVSAIEQLELYKMIMKNYVDHNASNTVHVRENEWKEVEEWVYDNWNDIVGVTFLSLDDNFYQLLPYEAIDKQTYEDLLAKTPFFNPNIINKFEFFDEEFDILDSECESGVCPIR